MKIRPLQDRVIVQRMDEEETTKGGIIIPDTCEGKASGRQESSPSGKGKVGDDGKVTPLDVKAGDKILFGKYCGYRSEDRGRRLHHHARGRHPRRGGRQVKHKIHQEVAREMPAKMVKFSQEARDKVSARSQPAGRRGNRDAWAPRGATSYLEKSFGGPNVTKDGVTVAKEMEARGQVREHGRADGEGSR